MTEHITVGYDATPASSEAVLWAANEAVTRGASLRIVSCFDIPIGGDILLGFGFAQAMAFLETAGETEVSAIVSVVAERHPRLQITTCVVPGTPALVLTERLAANDLIVVGASSHDRAAGLRLGGTPRRLVRISPCPVVVVRGAASRGRPDRIVVGVDGSPTAQRSLLWAGEEADRHVVDLVVVHGWEYPYPAFSEGSNRARKLTEIDATYVLDRAVEFARERFAAPVTGRLVEADPTSAILGSLVDGDVAVLGSHGHGAIASGLLGSIVNSVLEQSAVPIVVIPAERPPVS